MFGEDEKEEDWLDTEISIDEPKNYKFFQTIYNNKSEKVITPVFYRTFQKYENNFKDTKIKYYVDKTSAELVVVNFDVKNEFRISFQNSPKVKIEEIYSKINANESKEYLMSFADLTIRNLTSLVEKFITVCPKE